MEKDMAASEKNYKINESYVIVTLVEIVIRSIGIFEFYAAIRIANRRVYATTIESINLSNNKLN